MAVDSTAELKALIDRLPRANLAKLPTPLEEAPRLSKALGGPRIFFKRDDLTGLALGGNKTRMFEFTLGEALQKGVTTIVAGAGVQSNYCRQLAAACSKLGLGLHLILRRTLGEVNIELQGNLLLDLMFNAEVEIIEADVLEQKRVIEDVAKRLAKEGHQVYMGRKSDLADLGLEAVGYVNCALELCNQLEEQDLEINRLFVSSSTTTQAGLVLGAKYLNSDFQIVGVNPVDWIEDVPSEIARIANEAAMRLGVNLSVNPSEIVNLGEYVGEGYGKLTSEGVEAIKLVARTEGILLDPVYSGKAMAALIDRIHKKEFKSDETVLFLHTGGFPALFAYNKDFNLDEKLAR
ncbi:MAG: D-cysteine desulfhydrase family protein [Deltaproteobacteria bacterium]|nr:D-cysteine desulfhydrase family protein [Deltaproteobacteria bacterium]